MASAREKRYGDQHNAVVTDRLRGSEVSDIAVDVKNRNFLENMPYDFNYSDTSANEDNSFRNHIR